LAGERAFSLHNFHLSETGREAPAGGAPIKRQPIVPILLELEKARKDATGFKKWKDFIKEVEAKKG